MALYHFTGGLDRWIKASGARGYLGLTIFFVISGLVIPYAMWRGRYRGPADAPAFILKRLTRLKPPYFAAIAITLVLGICQRWRRDFTVRLFMSARSSSCCMSAISTPSFISLG